MLSLTPPRHTSTLRNLAVPGKSRNFRFGSRPCENSRTFSHGPISFAFSSPETVQRRRNHGCLRSAPPVAKFRGVLTRPRSNRRVQSAFRERSVLAPLSHSVYDRFFWLGGTGGVGLSGHRGEIGNHKVAGKIGVTTMAALPRNQRLSQKPLAFGRGFFVVHGDPCELVSVGRLTFDPARRLKTAFRSVN